MIDVHAKDVIAGMVDQGIRDIGEFEWVMQLRYYQVGKQCRVRCV